MRCAAQGVTVDFQQLLKRHGVGRRVEVADVGHQKTQRVADAAVRIDHPRQDFVVDVEVTRVIGGGHPQTQNFGAHFVCDLLRGNGVAQAFAHLATLTIGGKTVGQQAFVGRTVVQSATQQQRAVEPASVLVVAFQVQVGFGAALVKGRAVIGVFVAAAQDVLEGRTRVKPNLQNVSALGVVRCVVTWLVEDALYRLTAPCFNAALLHDVRGLIQNFHGAWMQLTAVFVQEKRHRHAPRTLARNAPVGTVGDHVAQTRFAVLRVEVGVVDGVQRQFTQRFVRLVGDESARGFFGGAVKTIHANEPLCGGAVDDRRFVSPAMRVAVGDGLRGHQAIGVLQGLQNDRHGFPDVQTAKQRKVVGIAAVALHWVQDVGVLHAMRHAGVEVIDAVGRGAVDDAGAVVGGGVIGEVHGRGALVGRIDMRQGMVELDQIELLTLGGGDDLALQFPSRQA